MKSTPKDNNSVEFKIQINELDEDTKTVKQFFHDLLVYMNKNDLTLNTDVDGEIENFVKHIPNRELDMKFESWIIEKVEGVKQEFKSALNKKLLILKKSILAKQSLINNSTNDDELVTIAKRLGCYEI